MMRKIKTSFTLKLRNESGLIFPYTLFLMLMLSTALLTVLEQVYFNESQYRILDEQFTFQNITQMTIYDFTQQKNDLEITKEPNTMFFSYETGFSELTYYLIEEPYTQLNINVVTKSGKKFTYRTIIDV